MQEEYVKEKKIVDKSKEEMNKMLIQSIINTSSNIEVARKNYEFAEGECLFDHWNFDKYEQQLFQKITEWIDI